MTEITRDDVAKNLLVLGLIGYDYHGKIEHPRMGLYGAAIRCSASIPFDRLLELAKKKGWKNRPRLGRCGSARKGHQKRAAVGKRGC